MLNKILALAYSIESELIENRREIHKNPELAEKEFETSKFILKKLENLGLEIENQKTNTGIVALLRGKPGKTVMLRADFDALPIEEQNDVCYRSQNPNIMHACGHDAHASILLGTAKILSQLKYSLEGNVKFIFQPGEEIGFGAAAMIKEEILENPKVDAAFALHVDPLLDRGKVGYREGAICALGGGFEIVIIGKGGHGAAPHLSVDPIIITAEIIQALQTISSSKLNPSEPFVLTIGTVNGGSKANIIPDIVTLTGTVRALNKDIIDSSFKYIESIVSHITKAHGADYKVQLRSGAFPLMNDGEMTGIIKEAGVEILGENGLINVPAYLVGEDFSLFAKLVPSSMVFLGVGFESIDNYPLHHSKFQIDEKALPIGAALLANTAYKFLKS